MQDPWSPADTADCDVFGLAVSDWLAATIVTGDAVVPGSVGATSTPAGLAIADVWFDTVREWLMLRITASPVAVYHVRFSFTTTSGRQVHRTVRLTVRAM